MIVATENWNRIPLLHIYKDGMTGDAPVVIFLHGFLSAKEHNLHYAYQLVEKGMRVLLPDAYLHGERAIEMSEEQMNLNFWKIVLKSVEEVQTIHAELINRKLLTTNRIGIAGTSMGGIVTSGCLAIYDWIQSAAICMGVTSYTKLAEHQLADFAARGIQFPITEQQKNEMLHMFAKFDLENKRAIFAHTPILFWHGKRDQVVPYAMTRPFYEELEASGEQGKSAYIADAKAGHAVSRSGVLAVTDWLAQNLA
ncbi:MAG: prolyl oligopeptidase family serine peptidase [Solibacillus sp.]